MTEKLELSDIQGNILFSYNLPFARFFFLEIKDPVKGRIFVNEVRKQVTTAVPWKRIDNRDFRDGDYREHEKPDCAVNIAFSWWGLIALNLPTRTIRDMPAEFINGMYRRCHIIGDTGLNNPEKDRWDTIWLDAVSQAAQNEKSKRSPDGQPVPLSAPNFNKVHILISIYANVDSQSAKFAPHPELEERTRWLRKLCENTQGGIEVLRGHRRQSTTEDYQEANFLRRQQDGAAQYDNEHFGFADGMGDPVFEGQYTSDPELGKLRVIGRGRLVTPAHAKDPRQRWEPIATGEFLLGHADESQELPEAPRPASFVRNGTFMVYRKLHQNVKAFNDYVSKQAELYLQTVGIDEVPALRHQAAVETIKAKMVGRWVDGIPLMVAATYEEWKAVKQAWVEKEAQKEYTYKTSALYPFGYQHDPSYQRMIMDFEYANDPEGARCPLGAHIRRSNTRDMLDPTPERHGDRLIGSSPLDKRRRILRRGIPYGEFDPATKSDDRESGIIFIALCTSLFRQFEFMQQQWINFGMDFSAGNDTCPVVGNRFAGDQEMCVKHVIPSDPKGNKPPFICNALPQFVETRGGEYFFVPSMTALRMIAAGTVDPT